MPGIDLSALSEKIGLPFHVSLHMLMVLLGAIFTFLLVSAAARRQGNLPKSKLGHMVEAITLYLRDEVARPNIGAKDGDKWMPLLATTFFFILVLNLMGLVPFFAGATANISVTAALALMVFLTFNLAGMAHNGPIHYIKNLIPGGVPWWVLPILIPVEFLSLIIRSFSLTVRLFANMTAGHIMIMVIAGLISVLGPMVSGALLQSLHGASGIVALGLVAPVPMALLLFILVLKVAVCFLQAFVFVFLSSLYIGGALHQEH
jgi:F-type H+-transporting ATPase subunit a